MITCVELRLYNKNGPVAWVASEFNRPKYVEPFLHLEQDWLSMEEEGRLDEENLAELIDVLIAAQNVMLRWKDVLAAVPENLKKGADDDDE